jgi:hypothetical protein
MGNRTDRTDGRFDREAYRRIVDSYARLRDLGFFTANIFSS